MFAENVNLPANAAALPAPAVGEDRRTIARQSHGERRDFTALRREPGVAAPPPAKSGNAVCAMRETLHQR